MGHLIRDEMYVSLWWRVVLSARAQNGPIRVENETTLRAAVVTGLITSLWGKPKRWILRQIFRSSRVFLGLYGTVVFIAIRDFSVQGESDLWSDARPAMDGVVCLSILSLKGGVNISNNFTKRRQNGFKIGTRDKFATHLRYKNFTSNEIVIYTFFFTIGDLIPIQFSIYTGCRIHHLLWA